MFESKLANVMASEHSDATPTWNLACHHAKSFREGIGTRIQRPIQTYPESLAVFEEATPEHGTPPHDIISDLVQKAEPGLHAMTGPRFYGWVIGNSHEVGVAADWLTAAWGQNTGNHSATPAAAAAETVAAEWMLDLLGLPSESSVGFVTGCTMAHFVTLAAARGEVLARLGWNVEAEGLSGSPSIKVILGEEAHSTVYSALKYLGIGKKQVVQVAVDANGAICQENFAKAISESTEDQAVIVVLQAGQLNTGTFDPLRPLINKARELKNCWIHVDGAFGLWARACPDRAYLADGIELADSWAVDGHKWLQTPYDCGYAIVRDAEAHRRAMTIAASYLPSAAEGERDPAHYVPELSRRARGFATWAMIKHLGRDGIAAMVSRHCQYARLLAELLVTERGVQVMNDVVLNQLAVRFGADQTQEYGDAITQKTIAEVQREGTCFAGGAKWRGVWIMRISVIGFSMTEADVRLSAEAIIRAYRKVSVE